MLQKQKKVMVGEYLVTLNKDVDINEIMNQFSNYGAKVVKDLGRGRYLIRLDQDPGLDVLKQQDCFKQAACKIQPNFKYQSSDNPSFITR